MKNRKHFFIAMFTLPFLLMGTSARAQVPVVSIATGIIKKVIIAMDLKVQQLQNQTIALQNAEASAENALHRSSLNDIGNWLGRERQLYEQYYRELATVRTVIAGYDEVKRIIRQQEELIAEWHNASRLLHRDRHFTASELRQMDAIYSGILGESSRNLSEVLIAVQSFSTKMSDAERLNLIHRASSGMQVSLDRLRQFNQQNKRLSLARAADDNDRAAVRSWYGLEK